MEKIFYGKVLLGIKITKLTKGSTPATDGTASLQLVTLKHPKGTSLDSHLHKGVFHVTEAAETCFVVKKGKVRLDLYSSNKEFVKKIFLKEGEIFITMNGSGHGVFFLEDSEVLEIKNGPFIEDKVLI